MTDSFHKIIHIDMDAFFAAVEQLDNPHLRGKPVAVGGRPESRGVVAAASYEARKFGVRSAMSSFKAARLCPDLLFIPGRIARYREVSEKIHSIFRDYTHIIEPLSLDEAYLDVTNCDQLQGSATLIAQEIKQRIQQQTGLTASAGVSYNKFLAKLASDMDKPDGLFIIKPGEATTIIHDLPVNKLFGVGKVTAKKMQDLNIYKIGDIKRFGRELLMHHFGKQADYYYNLASGIDRRPVNASRLRKSIGRETTFNHDLMDLAQIQEQINHLLQQVFKRMQHYHVYAKTITLKVKYYDFDLITRSQTSNDVYVDQDEMLKVLMILLEKTQAGQKAIRLLGVSVSGLLPDQVDPHKQAFLF